MLPALCSALRVPSPCPYPSILGRSQGSERICLVILDNDVPQFPGQLRGQLGHWVDPMERLAWEDLGVRRGNTQGRWAVAPHWRGIFQLVHLRVILGPQLHLASLGSGSRGMVDRGPQS